MSKIRLHGSSSGYTEIAPVAASGNNTLTLPDDGTIISKDSNGAVGVTSITVGTGVTIGDGRVTCSTLHGSGANITGISTAATSDFVKLQAADASSTVTQLNFDDLDVTTYKFFDLVGTFQPQTNGEYFRMRFRTGGASGSDVTSTDYGYGYTVPYPTNNTGATSADGQNQLLLSTTVGNDTGEAMSINMRISFADSSAPTNPKYLMNFVTWGGTYREQSNGFRGVTGTGHLYTASTISTGFSVSFSSGGIDEYSYVLYGMKR